MSNNVSNTTTNVLHIRPEPVAGTAAGEMDTALTAASLEVVVCGDVYEGLARVTRTEPGSPRAIITSVDGLGAAEMEFFSLIPRIRRDVSVYVYGNERSAARVASAIELGATAEATEDVIRKLTERAAFLPEQFNVQDAGHGDAAPAQASADSPATVGAEWSVGVDAEQCATVVAEEPSCAGKNRVEAQDETIDEDSLSGPVRVPWQRYQNGPHREAPDRRGPTSNVPKVADPPVSRELAREPLISEEELRALLADDTPAIAPDDRVESGSHEHGSPASDKQDDQRHVP